MPPKTASTTKIPRTRMGSSPVRADIPVATPPIQRSPPRLMPRPRIQVKKPLLDDGCSCGAAAG